jgi:serine/threonine protein kinase
VEVEGSDRRRKDGGKDPLIGATLDGRYRILRRIAAGGMGAVYEGEQIAIHRRVAIKCLHAHLARDEEMVSRFRREALATTKIGHPHIVEVLDLGEMDDGTLFMVLELLAGRDLARVLEEDGPLAVGRAVRIALEVCAGVAAAHDKGIVHRDLKPENVFLIERNGNRDFVKVLDFGVSKIRAQLEGGPEDSKTRTGTALGTPYYMAPEQAQGKRDVDHRADVYALGVILFRILTGLHPFDDTSYPMLILKICTEPPPRVATWRSDVPKELVWLVERMLAKEPEDRPASMDEVARELAAFRSIEGPARLTGASAPAASAPDILAVRSPRGAARDHSPAAMAATHRASPESRRPPHDDDEEIDDESKSVITPPRKSPVAMLVAGVLAIATAAMIAWAVIGGDEPIGSSREPEEIALPTPQPPVVRALSPGEGRGGGWSWINPRPRAMPTWYAVHVGGPGLVAIVGQDGAAARFFGDSTLVSWRSGTERTLRSVVWTSSDDAIAAGDGGALVRLTPQGPRAITTGTEVDLRAVIVGSGIEAIVAGDAGTLLRVAGDRVTAIATGIEGALLTLHARGDAIWIAGERGVIARLVQTPAGAVIEREGSGTGITLRAIGGCARGDLYAAGDQATLIRRTADGAWQTVRTDVDTGESFRAITCDRGRAAIVGSEGTVLLASGGRVVRLPSAWDRAWHGASGARDQSAWIVGAGGRLATIEEDHVLTRSAGPTVPLRDVSAIAGAVVAVGEWGRIVRERERGYEESESPTDAGLAAVAALDESRLIAVGDVGAIVEVRWDGATLLESPTDASLRDVIVGGDGRVLAVGTGGTLVRGTIGSLTATQLPESGDLWAIEGEPDDAIAVGEEGSVFHLGGSGATRWAVCEGMSLRALARTPSGALAVGATAGGEGVILGLEPDGCVRQHQGGAPLSSIALGPDGRPMAVGDRGAAWARAADGTWSAIDLDLGGNHARAIRRIGRHVYVVGTGGAIVRQVVVDGSR